MRIVFNILIILSVILVNSCAKVSLFDELANSRLKVILKGTYASNDPRDWEWDADNIKDDSIDDHPLYEDSNSTVPSVFMLDIAEMRINKVLKPYQSKQRFQ